MDPVSRRQALGLLSAPVVGVTVAGLGRAAEGGKDDPGEHLVVGPFQIDGWFLKTVERAPLGGPLEPLSTPRPGDLTKVLAGCRVYVLERRAGTNKAARFATDDYPKVVVEGPLAGEWKDGKKKFVVSVAAVTATGVETHYDGLRRKGAAVPAGRGHHGDHPLVGPGRPGRGPRRLPLL